MKLRPHVILRAQLTAIAGKGCYLDFVLRNKVGAIISVVLHLAFGSPTPAE
jgi:hypothetical protein